MISPSIELASGKVSPFFHFDVILHSCVADGLEEAACEDHVCVGEVATWICGAEESVRLP